MKLRKFAAVLLCGMALTFGLTACTAESTEAPAKTEEAPAESVEAPAEVAEVPAESAEAEEIPTESAETLAETAEASGEEAETVEEIPEVAAAFASHLDYVAEKEENIECVILIEALEGSFKEDVKPEEITFGEGIAEASEVEIVANDETVLEVGFVIPKGDLDVDNFSIKGSLLLADGVLLDTRGNAVGEMGEITVYEMDMTDRASSQDKLIDGTLTLRHKGGYVAQFFVYWDEVTVDADGNETVTRKSWSGNGDNKTAGFMEMIQLRNGRNLSVTAQGATGLLWDPWITSYHKDGLEVYPEITLTVSGTTLDQKAVMDPWQ